MRSVPFAPLEPALYREAVRRALAEDLGWGDVTTEATVDPSLRARGVILAKCECVIAGLDIAAEAFSQLDPAVVFTKNVEDGQRCSSGTTIAVVRGSAAAMLTAERTALNFLCHLSGVATATADLCAAIEGHKARIVCTRKTTPGLRSLEKYAVRMGGGGNHRFGLDGAVLIKDNHIAIAGGIRPAVERARRHAGHLTRIEVEVDTLAQLAEVLALKVDAVLLDIYMPEKDGFAVLAAVKADPRLAHVPVLMISGGGDHEDLVRCIEMGAVDYLPKPFNQAVLRARLAACIAAKRQRDREIQHLQQSVAASADSNPNNVLAMIGKIEMITHTMTRALRP